MTNTNTRDRDLVLNRAGHANFCMRCLYGLPSSMAEADSSRVAVGFYCLGALDVLGLLDAKAKSADRTAWRAWIWEQQVVRRRRDGTGTGTGAGSSGPAYVNEAEGGGGPGEDEHVGGFRPGPFMHTGGPEAVDVLDVDVDADADPPHLIMTYTALLSLAILRDDFTRLDRGGLVGLLRATQQVDGSFTAIPGQGEADIRMVYTAFAICAMLDDWRGVDVPRALDFVKRCITYEGGFGQAPGNEAQGGPTYCALVTLALAPAAYSDTAALGPGERRRTLRWLAHMQSAKEGDGEGGFAGRTQKDADACYSFWCGAGMNILGADGLVERGAHTRFLAGCQFRIGGIGKARDVHADPYHTYLALAALALYPPHPRQAEDGGDGLDGDGEGNGGGERDGGMEAEARASWVLPRLDVLLNATEDTARWARAGVSGRGTNNNIV
ncbi:hypothetical protein M0805_009158 [Coniferiporia weirii]|nr:hypothetical protein M0805_009158 [Coniferiporia weirii]